MKKLSLSIVPVLFLTTLTCCTSSPSIVTNPKTGETASCAITAMSQTIADRVADVCQKNYEAAGWVGVPSQIADTSHLGL
jgi:hypothetical protein